MNMTKEIRAELRDLKHLERALNRNIKIAGRLLERAFRSATRECELVERANGKAIAKLQRRRAILEGRLS